MSVYTVISKNELSLWLENFSIGKLENFQGIVSGIENTNYYVNTTKGKYVLTIFEKLRASELNYYLNLMSHLSLEGLPVASPVVNRNNSFVGIIKNKPASIVTRLNGDPVNAPHKYHCSEVGRTLAQIHESGLSYEKILTNPRGKRWWEAAAKKIYKFIKPEARDMLQDEIAIQKSLMADDLPRGVIHGDLFRDNVLFHGSNIGGVIDFYFACNDMLIYDLAITVNDWCITESHELDLIKAGNLIKSYQQIRSLTREEVEIWPYMLRAAALRFWVSRLYDFHLPRPGELTHAHSPLIFQFLLKNYRKNTDKYAGLL